MSRGPLEVLREVASFMAQAHPSFSTADEIREAIAQVEALVECADELRDLMEAVRTGDYVPDSFTVQPIAFALAPFTPGQDSEGGDHA